MPKSGRPLRVEGPEGRPEVPGVHQVKERGALAAGEDQAVDVRRARPGFRTSTGSDAGAPERRGVEREVSLEREDADPHRAHHPRVCRSSPAASLDVSRPAIASPSSSLTRASTSGSR